MFVFSISILCKNLINLGSIYSASNESLRGFGEIEYDTNISLISWVMSLRYCTISLWGCLKLITMKVIEIYCPAKTRRCFFVIIVPYIINDLQKNINTKTRWKSSRIILWLEKYMKSLWNKPNDCSFFLFIFIEVNKRSFTNTTS